VYGEDEHMAKTARNGDIEIGYEEFGSPGGQPLLLIMGLTFQMVWWPDEFCEQLAERGFHVVRFDNRDTGLSTRFAKGDKYTARDMVSDATAVMDALGWKSAHIAGASLGAGLAQFLATHEPERVTTLTLIMSGGVGGRLKALRVLQFGVLAKLARQRFGTDREGQIESQMAVIRAMSSAEHPYDEAWVRRTAEIAVDRGGIDPAATQRQTAAGFTTGNQTARLKQLTVPTLVVHGEDDPLIRVRAARELAAVIPGAKLVVYPAMGHEIPAHLFGPLADEILANSKR
jgi:pimeloyl-ACP methyl ester carboxylesterase